MCRGNFIHISATINTTRLITFSQSQLRHRVNNPNHIKGCLNPGAIAQIRKLKINRRKISSPRLNLTARGVNQNNLKQIRTTESNGLEVVNNIRLATLNARLVKNKDLIISLELNDHKMDIAVITYTWLKDTLEDKAWTNQSELIQGNYKVKVHNRLGPKKGGGIVLIHKSLPSTSTSERKTITIEYAIWKIEIKNKSLHVIGIYYPHQMLKTVQQTTCS